MTHILLIPANLSQSERDYVLKNYALLKKLEIIRKYILPEGSILDKIDLEIVNLQKTDLNALSSVKSKENLNIPALKEI